MKKQLIDFRILDNRSLSDDTVRLILTPTNYQPLPEIQPGQFVNVRIPNGSETFLRRPISVNRVRRLGNELHLVVKVVGEGTRILASLPKESILNILLPLGNGFPMKDVSGKRVLVIGGGVGVAPLLFYGEKLKEVGAFPTFLLGARTSKDLLMAGEFSAVAPTCFTTEDGSLGVKGFVTDSPLLIAGSAEVADFDFWVCCGPAPMMKAVAKCAKTREKVCYVSLENMMACGLGACLCCVEKTVRGNLCVCTNGPVFNINELLW